MKKTTRSAAQTWTLAALRKAWIEFFAEKQHMQLPSAGLIPAGDPTLLFTTAGMVQFKAYFAGTETPPSKRVATIQKCLRTTDLGNVGRTDRHLTFFEMLGNFSFGDYFKREAILWAWEFSTQKLGIDPERIYVSVYLDDDEAEAIWHKEVGVPLERIKRLGKADNWWGPAGDSGACGPCSELYLDRGPQICETCNCSDKSACGLGGEGDRFMEYWNLVFNQFHQDTSGKLHPLPQTGIDTGSGLERVAALLNNLDSVFDTDEMRRIIARIEDLTAELRADKTRVVYAPANKEPFRVLTDHARAAAFAIGDGIYPGATGRGYVIRRIIRRAAMFARELGVFEPILYRLVDTIAEIYGPFYPALADKRADIAKRLRLEEERFLHTLEQGLGRLDELLAEHARSSAKTFRGEDAFLLYDTFGFPIEMTIELAAKVGLEVDMARFEACMEEQRKKAAAASKWKDLTLPADLPLKSDRATQFAGYDSPTGQANVLALIRDGKSVGALTAGESGFVILDRTPFYAEGGGQQGDAGQLTGSAGAVFEVGDTQKSGGFFLHIGELKSGALKVGDEVSAHIDEERRQGLTRHHSATHLLNNALRATLGDHVLQTGSLVAPDYLRFDFSHPEKVDAAALARVEAQVNSAIQTAAAVSAEVLPIEAARKKGAVATFGEKYGAEVRVVSMGDGGGLSIEFCGGCHVRNTGDIGFFHITRETSPGAGNRRIEALAGDRVLEYFQESLNDLHAKVGAHNERVQRALDGAPVPDGEALYLKNDLPDLAAAALKRASDVLHLHENMESMRARLQNAEKRLHKLEKERQSRKAGAIFDRADELLAAAESAGEIRVVAGVFADQDADSLRKLGDRLKEKGRGVAALLGATTARGPLLLYMADKKAVEQGLDAAALVRATAGLIGGGGGGRPDMAQAGGKSADRLDEAVAEAKRIALEQLSGAGK